MDPPSCCVLPALAALYKGYHLDIVDQLNSDGPVVKGKNLLRWKEIHFDSIVDVLKWLHLVLKWMHKQHRKGEHQLTEFSNP